MHYLLFFFYLVLFCRLIIRIKFFKNSGMDGRTLVGLFLVRVIAGLINGYINLYYYQGTDTAGFQLMGIDEYHLLFHQPAEYFTNIFQSGHQSGYGSFLESSNSFWNDTRNNIIVKMLSVFDIFSGLNFFINSLIFNFLIFFGAVGLYRVFVDILPASRIILMICIFLLPSTVYFSSGIHRDGLIFLSLSMIIYYMYFMIRRKQYLLRGILFTLLYISLIILLRNFVFIILFPALLAWFLAEQKPNYSFWVFLGVYFFIGTLFFCSGFLPPAFNLPLHVSNRQIDFILIARRGASAININPLYPNFRSFLNNLPQALNHSFMRPYLTEHLSFLYTLSGLEILFYEILIFLFIFFRKKIVSVYPLIYFCVFLTISTFLAIGYTIPIIGAIVRYRSIYLPFLLIPVLNYIDWTRLKKLSYSITS